MLNFYILYCAFIERTILVTVNKDPPGEFVRTASSQHVECCVACLSCAFRFLFDVGPTLMLKVCENKISRRVYTYL